uniref:DUF4062 domain-containing protein n=1 Tax=Rhodopseudomonas palustris (strain BisA53) TaxID=316055 RepID=Q07NW8_RHOP5
MVETVYQVFVSSTYADLKEQRRHVSETLAKAGYIPSGMELFPAADQQQLEFIKRVIDRCDYYVVVVGGRYGSLADENISFTEKEYEYALEKGIPVLAFLHASPDDIPAGKTDQDAQKAIKLRSFRDRLATGRMIDQWTDPHELCTKVVIAVAQAVNLKPGKGWIRGDQAIDPKILQELERTRIEYSALKARLQEIDRDIVTFPEHLAGPDDYLEFAITHEKEIVGSARYQIRELFTSIFEFLVRQDSESNIRIFLASKWANENNVASNNRYFYLVSETDAKTIRSHLESFGLMQLTRQAHEYMTFDQPRKEVYVAWSITHKGRRYMASLSAVIKTPRQGCPDKT